MLGFGHVALPVHVSIGDIRPSSVRVGPRVRFRNVPIHNLSVGNGIQGRHDLVERHGRALAHLLPLKITLGPLLASDVVVVLFDAVMVGLAVIRALCDPRHDLLRAGVGRLHPSSYLELGHLRLLLSGAHERSGATKDALAPPH